MEEKKLYLERPLLSARRFTSGAAPETGSKWKIKDSVRSVRCPPPYKSELKSGPVSNPGTVPFDWEQIPGRPKDGETSLKSNVVESSKVPKLHPGRTLTVGQQDFDKASVNYVVDKDEKRSVSDGSWNVQSSDENVEQSRSFRDGREGLDNCSSGNEDGEFVDALETLSRAESLLINCSFSDLIGWEDQGAEASGNSPIDSQTREIMMGRFLPAAKAMAVETPQHGPRNPPIIHQRLGQQRKMLNEDTGPQLRYGPDFVVECFQRDEDGDEKSDCHYYEEGNVHGKVCCLLPSLGLRSSFCLFNPLPEMSMHSRVPMPPQTKSQTRASVGLETSKHQENRKALENRDTPIHHLDKLDLPTFRELLAEENRSKDLGIGSNVAEKTLYVDTEDNARTLNVKSYASDASAKTEEVKIHGILSKKRDQNKVLDTSLVNAEKLNLKENGDKSEPQFRIPEFHLASSRGETNQQTRIAMQESSGREQDVFKNSTMLMRPKGLRKSEDSRIHREFPAPPALPKSPSDSWLGRMLPSISTKNSSVHSYRGAWISPNDKVSKPKSSDPKWETMVRMTKVQDKHLCFSEDRLKTIPEA